MEGDISLVNAAFETLAVSSPLVSVEVPNAIVARFHRGLITAQERDGFLLEARNILRRTSMLELADDAFYEANQVGFKFLVRALDAIHLGTAAVAARQQSRRGNQLRFCTADIRQADAAVALFGAGSVDLMPRLGS